MCSIVFSVKSYIFVAFLQVLCSEEARLKPVTEPSLLFLPHCESEFTAQIMHTFGVAPPCIASTAVLGEYL